MNKIWQALNKPRRVLSLHELLHLFGHHSTHHAAELAYIGYGFLHADFILGGIFTILFLCHVSAILLKE